MILPGKANLGHILRYVAWPLVLLLARDVLLTLAYMLLIHGSIDLPDLPIPLIGAAVAVYLTFRNTTAYARWWEARGLWGMLINHSRNSARQCQIFLPDSASEVRANLVQRQIAYAHALRLHLRRHAPAAKPTPRSGSRISVCVPPRRPGIGTVGEDRAIVDSVNCDLGATSI